MGYRCSASGIAYSLQHFSEKSVVQCSICNIWCIQYTSPRVGSVRNIWVLYTLHAIYAKCAKCATYSTLTVARVWYTITITITTITITSTLVQLHYDHLFDVDVKHFFVPPKPAEEQGVLLQEVGRDD